VPKENPLVIATVRSESLGISFIDEDSPESMHGERSAERDLPAARTCKSCKKVVKKIML